MTGSPDQDETTEDFHVYIVRKEEQKEWMAKAENGNQAAELCISAAAKVMNTIPSEPCSCCCCDAPFSSDDKPPAFIVLIPVGSNVSALARAVCSQCSTHNAHWLIKQGVRLKALASTPRPTGQIH